MSDSSDSYVPKQGDAVWIDFNPQLGREQAGRRPALVISPNRYNRRVGLVLVCPITRQIKGYPWEIPIPEELDVSGVVLADQVKSLDWQARKVEFICTVPSAVTNRAIATLRKLMPLQ
ncbi:MAG TPA: endoribonuclease MazF [Oscillatoriaceae cyanobacterium M33_DOE_052]|uniref:Endoribonuclease MazF n=1 Tax=Planktothricoides sp. SpSt-374 TaxID=2282167 RepID=A0A7C3ZV59_9CYAN|nr:endoribonuclease MazF [Oscillatoriaceae cyanobacterium M33_DOE_052]